MAFGFSLFAETWIRYPTFYETIIGNTPFPAVAGFVKGAAAAFLVIRSRPGDGKN
jgi:hypothetical protein